jgi:L-ascorbate metabolism protein UlaG (beta-lactamase superfamily)
MKLHALLIALFTLVAAPALAQGKTAKGKTTAQWWGHAAWIVTTPGGATIAIDPWLSNPKAPKGLTQPQKLDAILVSHAHFDHVGEAQALSKSTGAPIYGAAELIGLIGGEKDVGANAGGTFRVKDATIHLVEAVHSSGYGEAKSGGPKYGGSPLGFVIEIDHGPTLYHAGDTDVFASMALIAERFHPTVALLPIGGHYTMGPAGAALAAKLLKVKTVVPMHYGTFPALKGTPAELKQELKKQHVRAQVLAPKPGETLSW